MEIKKSVSWKNGELSFLDQRKLPLVKELITVSKLEDVAFAIEKMQIRGAPLIGIVAAFGFCIAANSYDRNDIDDFKKYMTTCSHRLSITRPTAKNLFWAIDRMELILKKEFESINDYRKLLEKEAIAILDEDISWNLAMGNYGAELFEKKVAILTHCNAGAMATGGYGTALGVIRSLYNQGKLKMVYVDETRPRLQGARITAFELNEENIPYKVVTDNMAAHIMSHGLIDGIITGADRIALNGDSANKIGTCGLAIIAKEYDIPFYIAAPSSTFDFEIETGREIIIEERDKDEVRNILGKVQIVPDGSEVFNPAFDVTPAKFIRAIITEKGVIKPPFKENIKKKFNL